VSALSALPVPSLPLRAIEVAGTRTTEPSTARPSDRTQAQAAEQVRACVVAVVLVGAMVTVPLMIVAVLVPALWSLPFLAAVHTPIFAVMAGHKLTRRLAATPA
jgi:hypothetical protein